MRIIALTGMLGYGYTEKALKKAFEQKPDYIGVDAGSTDPGPYYLGSGKSFTDRAAVKRDLSLSLPTAVKNKIPFIIGSAGGSGAKPHVEWLCEIIDEIAAEHKLSFKTAVIYADVEKDYVLEKFSLGKIKPLGKLEATLESIRSSNRIVAQLSIAPVIEALDNGADVIIAGRICDTAIYAAPAIRAGYDSGLAFHMAKIMECGSMCSEPLSASDVMMGEIDNDSFVLTPMNDSRKCTVLRVAAHTMYEQSDPYKIYEPDGVIDLENSSYEQINERSVKVSGSVLTEAAVKTLKLEGTKIKGHRTISIAGVNDPVTIDNVDLIFEGAKEFAQSNFPDLKAQDYTITLKKYGSRESNLGIIIEVIGSTKEISQAICAVVRARMLHFDYTGRKSTAGNLAFPYSPSDIYMGEVYTFSLYHLCEVGDEKECAKTVYGGYNDGKAY